jgi:uncharacterized protein
MLPITLTMAALAALMNTILMARAGQARGKAKISVGDGGNDLLLRRMRAQANFLESVPLLLILLGLIEHYLKTINQSYGHGPIALWVISIIVIFGRVTHALAMENRFPNGRVIGTLLSVLAFIAAAIFALYIVFTGDTSPVVTNTLVAGA